jgi:hypothetical protein
MNAARERLAVGVVDADLKLVSKGLRAKQGEENETEALANSPNGTPRRAFPTDDTTDVREYHCFAMQYKY